MSRPLGSFILLLALWVQILAPVAALRAVTGVVTNPFSGLTLCGHSLADAADDAADDAKHPAPSLCGLCCAAIAVLDAPPPAAASIALAWAVLIFRALPNGPIHSVERTFTRVRDPPVPA